MKYHQSDKVREILSKARKDKKTTGKILKSVQGVRSVVLDQAFHDAHDVVFRRTDCLECANCCKTSSPIITNKDIDRISSFLRMKAGDFVVQYLRIDEDEDYVFCQIPCVFLNEDNTCRIYEYRPKACREYPHTDRKNMNEILDLTYKNAMVCPAVFEIIQILDKQLSNRK